MKTLFKLLAIGGAGYVALDYFGIVPGIPGLKHSPTGEANPATPPPASSGGPAQQAGGPAAPPAPQPAVVQPIRAQPIIYTAPPPQPAVVPYQPAPYQQPTPPAQNVTSIDDTVSNRMRAATDRNYAAIFPTQLTADEWNYYRQNATGRQYDIDGLFDPSNRGELMTAAVFLQRSADVYGLSGLVAAMTGRGAR